MKRAMILMLVLSLLALCAPALAEGGSEVAVLNENDVLAIDLDGDGAQERVSWAMVPGEYDSYLTLTVEPDGGEAASYTTGILYGEHVWIADLDGDGLQEVLLSGDVMSDDYYTWCLHYVGGALYEVLFPDTGRGDNTDDAYYRYGYGAIDALDGNRLTLEGSQDTLGTWFAARTVTLSPAGRFEFCDDGLWVRNLDGLEDADLWGYGALKLTASLPYTDGNGKAIGMLTPGDVILVTATDKRETAWFITPDGTRGALEISFDFDKGWGLLVDGIPEADCFEMVPYAD